MSCICRFDAMIPWEGIIEGLKSSVGSVLG